MIKRCLQGGKQPATVANAAEIKRGFREHHQALIAHGAQLKLKGLRLLSPRPFKIDSYRTGMFGLSILIANLVDVARYSVSYTLGTRALALLPGPPRIEPGVEGVRARARFSSAGWDRGQT